MLEVWHSCKHYGCEISTPNDYCLDHEDRTIWIVSGYMRSGTSMMMNCLGNAGMKIAYNPDKDAEFRERMGSEDYDPNPYGFWELGQPLLKAPEFPEKYIGCLVKCLLSDRIRELPSGPSYKVCIMVRDPDEIRRSVLKTKHGDMSPRMKDVLANYQASCVEHILGLSYRNDTEVVPINYNKLLENPVSWFTRLSNAGWPIDPLEASRHVDLSLYRHRGKV